jgi:hypothetical protein
MPTLFDPPPKLIIDDTLFVLYQVPASNSPVFFFLLDESLHSGSVLYPGTGLRHSPVLLRSISSTTLQYLTSMETFPVTQIRCVGALS